MFSWLYVQALAEQDDEDGSNVDGEEVRLMWCCRVGQELDQRQTKKRIRIIYF